MGTTDGQLVKGTPEGSPISTFVNFRMLHRQEARGLQRAKALECPV